jgi:hypothetical protein
MPSYTVKLPAAPCEASIGYTIGIQVNYEAPLTRTPALCGTINTPQIAKGQASVTYLSKETPAAATPVPVFTDLSTIGSLIVGNVHINDDAILTGGALGVQEFGEGSKSITWTAIYTFFAHALTTHAALPTPTPSP